MASKKKPATGQKKKKVAKPKKVAISSYPIIKEASESWFYLGGTAVFFILAAVGIFNHEMWRDEFQAWMIATASSGLGSFFTNVAYEGQPFLWHFLLFIGSLFSDNAVVMQAIHLIIATATAFLIFKYAPFQKWQTVLLVFGYYFFYEYAQISRSYALGGLALIGFCILFRKPSENIIWIGVVLALLANSSTHGFMLAVSLSGIVLLGYLFKRYSIPSTKNLGIGASIAIVGILLAIIFIYPQEDNGYSVMWAKGYDAKRLGLAISTIYKSYFPVPDFSKVAFWNTNILLNDPFDALPFLGVLCFLIPLLAFRKYPLVLILFLGATIGLTAFNYLTLLLYQRHVGALFLLLIVCIWLYYDRTPKEKPQGLDLWSEWSMTGFFSLLLVLNFIAGLFAFYTDLTKPFSNSKKISTYLLQEKFKKMPVVGWSDFVGSSLPALINRPVFYPERNEEGTFIIWDKKRSGKQLNDVLQKMDQLCKQRKTNILGAFSQELTYTQNNQATKLKQYAISNENELVFLTQFDEACISGDEKYYLYMARPKQ